MFTVGRSFLFSLPYIISKMCCGKSGADASGSTSAWLEGSLSSTNVVLGGSSVLLGGSMSVTSRLSCLFSLSAFTSPFPNTKHTHIKPSKAHAVEGVMGMVIELWAACLEMKMCSLLTSTPLLSLLFVQRPPLHEVA